MSVHKVVHNKTQSSTNSKSGTSDSRLKGVLQKINEQMYERNVELTVKNRTLSVLRDLYEIINTTLGVDDTAERLIHVITRQMEFRGGSILLVNRKTRVLDVVATASSRKKPGKTSTEIIHAINKMSIPMRKSDNLAVKVYRTRKRKVTKNMYDFLKPNTTKEEAEDMQKKLRVQTLVAYPISFGGDVFGVMILAMDKPVKDLSRAERETLAEIIDVVGIALEQAKIYAQLRTANKKLKELDKMKDDFVSVASHELRTPMTAIKSYLWMALSGKGGDLTEKQKYYLIRSYNSTDRLIKLVNDMLNISRIESGRISLDFNKVNMQNLVQEVYEEVKPRADELKLGIVINDTLSSSKKNGQSDKAKEHSGKSIKAEGLPDVIADADKIKEVLFNLIGNSLKFTDPGGKITVHFSKNADMLNVHVTDTGRGIADKDMSTLFTKFGMVKGSYATNKKASGTGLGLYISKAIIELHKGKMDVVSDGVGKGSTFSFSLPVYSEAAFRKYKKRSRKGSVGIVHSGFKSDFS